MKLKQWLPEYRNMTYAEYKKLPEKTKLIIRRDFRHFNLIEELKNDPNQIEMLEMYEERRKKEKWIEIKPKSRDSIYEILDKEKIRYETSLKIGGVDERGNYTALFHRWQNGHRQVLVTDQMWGVVVATPHLWLGKQIGIGKMMFEAFEAKLKEERTKGCVIDDIIASVVTKQGEALVTRNGFELISDYMDTVQYKLYKKDGECLR